MSRFCLRLMGQICAMAAIGMMPAVGFAEQNQQREEIAIPDSNATSRHPRVAFEKLTQDFGSVLRGEKLTHKFVFTNRGDGPLIIYGVHAACGCTATEMERGKVYQSGETGTVEVVFDTANFRGPTAKAVTVMTNERPISERILTVRAVIREEFVVEPPLVDFGDLVVDGVGRSRVTIRGKSTGFDIRGFDFPKDVLDVSVTRPDTATWLLEVASKPGIPIGFLKQSITARTSSRAMPEVAIPVRALVVGNLATAPQYLEFGAVEPGSQQKRQVSIKGVAPFRVTGVRTSMHVNGEPVKDVAPFIRVALPGDEKNEQKYTIELLNAPTSVDGQRLAGSVHGRLILETTDPKQPTLPMDFYAFFR